MLTMVSFAVDVVVVSAVLLQLSSVRVYCKLLRPELVVLGSTCLHGRGLVHSLLLSIRRSKRKPRVRICAIAQFVLCFWRVLFLYGRSINK